MPPEMQEPETGEVTASPRKPALSTSNKGLFNTVELRLFRYTAVLMSLVVLIALTGIVVWSLSWVLGAFYNLILSLSIAGILALVLHPLVEFLERRLHFNRLVAISSLLTLFFMVIGGMIFLIVPLVISQIVQLMTVLPDSVARWESHFSFHFPEVSSMISSRMENSGSDESEPALKGAGGTIMSYLGIVAALGFMPLFLFFTLLSWGGIRSKVTELLSVFHEPTQRKALYFMDLFLEYVTAFFQGQLIIALCMGALYAGSFTLIGLDFGVLIGLVLGLLNIVPFLGTLIGLLVVLPMAYLQPEGGAQLMIMAGLVFAAVQVVESWLLTPKIMGNRSGLHPALVIISLFFWGTILGGITGMILAVPLTAFFVAIWSEIKASAKHTLSERDSQS